MDTITSIDFSVLHFILEYCRNGFFDCLMPFFNDWNRILIIWIGFSIFLFAVPSYRKYIPFYFLALLLSFLLGIMIIKPLVARIRPCNIELVSMLVSRPQSYSFPSGHSMTSFCAAIFLWKTNHKIGGIALVLAVIIAFSRLYLFVHYPSDVVAGAILGGIIGYILHYGARKIYR